MYSVAQSIKRLRLLLFLIIHVTTVRVNANSCHCLFLCLFVCVFCLFDSLFVCDFSSHSRIFNSRGDVTITDDEMLILTNA